eukprot:TRINITY_DN4151_c0_g1_i1.p2 TRINITY_DN4151_c0_g1~~TRINITY_DN4151_c0_g1_i1.p2  ORF type:complete len:1110 (-),score=470.54 TRINITY_DN4151_c0_g1_i1:1241-4570(-)
MKVILFALLVASVATFASAGAAPGDYGFLRVAHFVEGGPKVFVTLQAGKSNAVRIFNDVEFTNVTTYQTVLKGGAILSVYGAADDKLIGAANITVDTAAYQTVLVSASKGKPTLTSITDEYIKPSDNAETEAHIRFVNVGPTSAVDIAVKSGNGTKVVATTKAGLGGQSKYIVRKVGDDKFTFMTKSGAGNDTKSTKIGSAAVTIAGETIYSVFILGNNTHATGQSSVDTEYVKRPSFAMVRFTNAAPGASNLDFAIDGEKLASAQDVAYGFTTEYKQYSAKTVVVTATVYGSDTVVFNKTVDLDGSKYYTIGALGNPGETFGHYWIDNFPVNQLRYGFMGVRFVHASPDAGRVNVFVDKKATWSDIDFTNATDYYVANGGDYTIDVYGSVNGTKTLLLAYKVTLKADEFQTFFLEGDVNALPSPTPAPASPSPAPQSPSPKPSNGTSPSPVPASPTAKPNATSPTPVPQSPTPKPNGTSPTPVPKSPTPVPKSPTPVPKSPTPVPGSPKPDAEVQSYKLVAASPTPVKKSPTPAPKNSPTTMPSPKPSNNGTSPSPKPHVNGTSPSPKPHVNGTSPSPVVPSPSPVSNPFALSGQLQLDYVAEAGAYVRVVYASVPLSNEVDFNAVNLYLNGSLFGNTKGYYYSNDDTKIPYGQAPTGVYEVTVTSAYDERIVFSGANVNLKSNVQYTLLVSGTYGTPTYNVTLIEDDNSLPDLSQTRIRVLSGATAPELDFVVKAIGSDEDPVVYEKVTQGVPTKYDEIMKGDYSIKVYLSPYKVNGTTTKPIFTVPKQTLNAGWVYTIFAEGVYSKKKSENTFGVLRASSFLETPVNELGADLNSFAVELLVDQAFSQVDTYALPASIRFIHAVDTTTPQGFNVYLNGSIAANVTFGNASHYIQLQPATWEMTIAVMGSPDQTPIKSFGTQIINAGSGDFISIAASGTEAAIVATELQDNLEKEPAVGFAAVRFLNLIPNAGNLTLSVGSVEAGKSLDYRQYSDYVEVAAQTTVDLTLAQGVKADTLTSDSLNVQPGFVYTIIADGDDKNPTISTVVDREFANCPAPKKAEKDTALIVGLTIGGFALGAILAGMIVYCSTKRSPHDLATTPLMSSA